MIDIARLINAEVTEKMLRDYADDVGCNRGDYVLANGILKAVSYIRNNIPTAYDPDAVVEELEKEFKLADAEKERCEKENPLQFDTAKGYAKGVSIAIEIVRNAGKEVGKMSKNEELKKAAEPLVKYLRENYHPHTTVIVDSMHAEVLEGIAVAKYEWKGENGEL